MCMPQAAFGKKGKTCQKKSADQMLFATQLYKLAGITGMGGGNDGDKDTAMKNAYSKFLQYCFETRDVATMVTANMTDSQKKMLTNNLSDGIPTF